MNVIKNRMNVSVVPIIYFSIQIHQSSTSQVVFQRTFVSYKIIFKCF